MSQRSVLDLCTVLVEVMIAMDYVRFASQGVPRDAAASLPSITAHKACVTCAECPADALCRDDSLSGQVAKVLAARGPAIVLTTRIEALFKGANASPAM
jgi:hypothetical protein